MVWHKFCLVIHLTTNSINSFEELTFKTGDTINIIGFKNLEDKWNPVCFGIENKL